jgi:hypothetical protein
MIRERNGEEYVWDRQYYFGLPVGGAKGNDPLCITQWNHVPSYQRVGIRKAEEESEKPTRLIPDGPLEFPHLQMVPVCAS